MSEPSDYTSLRALIGEWALPQIGATLAADAGADADITLTTAATNLYPLPTEPVTVGLMGYAALPYDIDAGLITSALTTDPIPSLGTLPFGMQAGKTYTITATTDSADPQYIEVLAEAPSLGSDPANGITLATTPATIASSAGATGTESLTFTVPADAWAVQIDLTGNPGDTWSNIILNEGAAVPPFNGDTASDDHYTYGWDGEAGISTSHRTPIVERSADALTWTVGQSLWDFLQPLVTASGLRLYCDESRVWHLVNPDEVPAGDPLTIAAGTNLIDATDTISAGDSANTFDAVLITYQWTTQAGPQTAYDYAGPEDGATLGVYEVTYQRPFPGAGAAAYILGQAAKRAGARQYTALTDYSAQPYRGGTFAGRGGVVSAVTFDLAQDEMTVTAQAAS